MKKSLTAVAAGLVALSACRPRPGIAGAERSGPLLANASIAAAAIEGALRSLDGATAWLGSEPRGAASLRGKVVVVDFWTYSCINWRRSLPYVRAWAEKYRGRGLVVVGVHSPEFGFERDLENVRAAVLEMKVDYPVAIDNDFAIWRAFANQAWPAVYLVDRRGRVRHHRFGEGDYDGLERLLQELLAEDGQGAVAGDLVSVSARGAEAAADWDDLRSPENYLGYERTLRFASPGGAAADHRRSYVVPAALGLNQWALGGAWTMGEEATTLHEPGGRVAYRFHARDLHLVMGPARRGAPVRFRVLVDGRPPGGARGEDVDREGNGTATAPRMYQLIRQPPPISDRRFEIEFVDPGIEIFSFTFG